MCAGDEQTLASIRDRIMGPHDLVTRDRGNKHGGGIHFERNKWIVAVKDDGRCYTIGPSHQHSRQLVSPIAAGKIMANEMNEDQLLRRDMLKVISPSYADKK